jgi:cathepsin A (carboxypeptidase C)
VSEDGTTTSSNKYSWNTNANLIYVDQPAGAGFSYADTAGYDSTEAEIAEDLYNFLQDFFAAHPEWADNAFYVFGESYAGHYVPAVSHRIWLGNTNKDGPFIPLNGSAIGNGLTDPEVQYPYYPQLAYTYAIQKIGKPVITKAAFDAMTAAAPQCVDMIKACQNSSIECYMAEEFCNSAMLAPYQLTGRNPYDIRIPCQTPPLCYDLSGVGLYLNNKTVQSALGVDRQWQSCNNFAHFDLSLDWMKNFQTQLPDLLNNGIRVMIYAGDVDFICNWLGNHAWTEALQWPGQSAFNAAQFVDYDNNGGQIKTASGFSFLRVYNAGHMVPMDQPAVALSLLTDFLNKKF